MNAVMELHNRHRRRHIADRRYTAEEYNRMAEKGLFAPDARMELIEGVIIYMSPQGSHHAGTVDLLNHLLIHAVGDHAIVRAQGPVRLDQWSEPEPDLMLLKPRTDFYRSKHPEGQDTLLAIEVSQSSLHFDRRIKVPLYARHQVPEVWIVNLRERVLQVYRGLENGKYADIVRIHRPGILGAAALPEVSFDLTNLFPA